MCSGKFKLFLPLALLGIPASALAQVASSAVTSAQAAPPPVTQAEFAALQRAVQNAQSAGDNAWMLVSAALVLLMTGPGLALFYGGLVRRKNILGTMMQSFAMMGLVTVLWASSSATRWPLATATASSAASSMSSCAASASPPIQPTLPPFPNRPT